MQIDIFKSMHGVPILTGAGVLLIIFLAVLFLIFPLWALIHCIRNPRYSAVTKGSWVILTILTWPLGAYSYVIWASRKTWLRILAILPFILVIVGAVWRLQKQLKELSKFDLNPKLEPISSTIGLPVSTQRPLGNLNLREKVDAYELLMRSNQWPIILKSFDKDQPLLVNSDPANRMALAKIAPIVALSYIQTGNSKKAAYYYALSAKISAELPPNVGYNKQFYLNKAVMLDPSSPYVQKVKQDLNGPK